MSSDSYLTLIITLLKRYRTVLKSNVLLASGSYSSGLQGPAASLEQSTLLIRVKPSLATVPLELGMLDRSLWG